MTNLESEMKETVNDELQISYRMSGVMIQMLLFEAEKSNLALSADVGYMENYQALENMKDFENLGSLESKKPAFSLNPVKKGGALPQLGGGSLGQVMMQNQMASQ